MKPETTAKRVGSQSEAGPSPVTNSHSKSWLTIPCAVKSLLDGEKEARWQRDSSTCTQVRMGMLWEISFNFQSKQSSSSCTRLHPHIHKTQRPRTICGRKNNMGCYVVSWLKAFLCLFAVRSTVKWLEINRNQCFFLQLFRFTQTSCFSFSVSLPLVRSSS